MEAPGILVNTKISHVKKKKFPTTTKPQMQNATRKHFLTFFYFFFFFLSTKRHKSNLATLPGLVCRVGVGEFGGISGVGGMGRNMALTLCLE